MPTKIYDTPGSYTFPAPLGVAQADSVDVYGAGSDAGRGDGGGGGGGYAGAYPYAWTPGGSITLDVGAGGVGTAGGQSDWDSSTLVANGGGIGSEWGGGAGGSGTGGTMQYNGGYGGSGGIDVDGGGGGGGAGPSGNGTNGADSLGIGEPGEGGAGGGGGAGAGGFGAYSGYPAGTNGSPYGGGGGGEAYDNTPGGNGGNGAVVVAWTCPTPSPQYCVPAGGLLSGGTSITIYGTDFSSFVTGSPRVTIDGVDCTSVTVVSATEITATSPALASVGAKDVVVYNEDGGTGTLSSGFVGYSIGGGLIAPGFNGGFNG